MQFDFSQQLGTKSKCDHRVHPPPPPLSVGVGGLSLLPNFQKRGEEGWGLTGSQFLEGVACKEEGDFFPGKGGGGGGLQFLLKIN